MAAIGWEEVGGVEREAFDLRNRAFSFLMHRYENLPRLATYLRWFEGDAAELAPSPTPRGAVARRRRRARRSGGGGRPGGS